MGIGLAAFGGKPPVAGDRPFNFVVINKLYYDFWFEPDAQLGVQFKLKIYKECTHSLGGDADYMHDYFSNPFIAVENAWAERISANGKRTPVTDLEKFNYKSPGILYSESDHYNYLFPPLNPGDRTVSTVVYSFRESRSVIPVFYGEPYYINDLKVNFRIPPGIDVSPYFFHCDSSDFKITRVKGKKEELIQISAADIKPVDTDKNDDINSSYYSPFIYFFVKGGKVENTPVYSLASVADLYKYNYSHLSMTPPADTAKLKEVVSKLVSDKRTQRENMESIFNWVKDNIQYVAIMEGKKTVVPEPASAVLNSKYGDCKGMTSLLNGLAGAAGIPLHYGWVGTRNISYQPSEIPIPFAFDHMIGIYIEGTDTLVLDATGKSSFMGDVSSRLYGKEVMVGLDDTHFALYKVPTPDPSVNKLKVNVRYFPSETNWNASYIANLEGQKKLLFNYLTKMPASSFEKNRKPNPVFPEMETSGATVSEISENDKNKAGMTWQQPLEKGAVKTSTSWLINPFPDKYKELLSINTEDRNMPIEMDYPFQDEITISVEIPEGYVLSSQPPEVLYADTLGEIRCRTTQNGRTVTSEFSLILKPLLIYPSEFSKFVTLKDTLKKCVSEYLVFRKEE